MKNIIFGKPSPLKGYTCVDMHFHTTYSDGAARVDEVLSRIRELGIGVAISDHNEIGGYLEAAKKKKKGDFLIPAIEVKSKELVDVLFYFYDEDGIRYFFKKEIEKNKKSLVRASKTTLPLDYIMSLGSRYKCMISIPHMYGYSMRIGRGDIFELNETELEKARIFEAINGGNSRDNNLRAVDYIEKNSKCFTGGSDGHSIYSLGNVLTCAKARTITEFFDAIHAKENKVFGIETRYGKIGEYTNFGINTIKNIFKNG